MIDWHQRHIDIARKERRAILKEGATEADFKSGRWPAGSLWLWALGIIGPPGSAVQPDTRTGGE